MEREYPHKLVIERQLELSQEMIGSLWMLLDEHHEEWASEARNILRNLIKILGYKISEEKRGVTSNYVLCNYYVHEYE